MPHPTCPQIWQQIQSKTSKSPILFKYKSVAYYWEHLTTGEWLRNKDPIKSAHLWLAEHSNEHGIKILDLEVEPGTQVLAFYVQEFVLEWASHTNIFLTDSTCEPMLGQQCYSLLIKSHSQRQ